MTISRSHLACALAMLALGCADSAGPDCPQGMIVDGECLPFDCPDRDCPDGYVCLEGLCAEILCLEVECGDGSICLGGRCYAENCESRTCPGLGEVCVEEECQPASCLGKDCPEGQRCAAGECYPVDCPTKYCPGYGEVCVEDECVERSCVGVDCAEGHVCAGGRCYPADCQQMGCPQGQVCVDDVCQQGACIGVECEAGYRCADGWCYPEDCPEETCADDEVCDSGRCVDADCVGIDCPPEHRCEDGACIQVTCPEPCTLDLQCQEADCGGWMLTCLFDPLGGVPVWSDSGDVCSDGDPCTQADRCEGETCIGAPLCDEPPAAYCDGDTRVYYAAVGTCVDGACDYGESRVDCPWGCEGGACNDDPCVGQPDGTECGERYCYGRIFRKRVCEGGACTGFEQIEHCRDGEDCTDDSCDPLTGCHHTPWRDGTVCGDAICQQGQYVAPACLDGVCEGATVIDICGGNEHCVEGEGCRCGESGQNCAGTDQDYCCVIPGPGESGCYDITSDDAHCGYACVNCGGGGTCRDGSCVP
ncbi:MAG: hypothetical protein JXR96_11080 [Deltaproteobacteria bacterium]|nr:hypothetical protein [Deltaproteobacteria bacterium]